MRLARRTLLTALGTLLLLSAASAQTPTPDNNAPATAPVVVQGGLAGDPPKLFGTYERDVPQEKNTFRFLFSHDERAVVGTLGSPHANKFGVVPNRIGTVIGGGGLLPTDGGDFGGFSVQARPTGMRLLGAYSRSATFSLEDALTIPSDRAGGIVSASAPRPRPFNLGVDLSNVSEFTNTSYSAGRSEGALLEGRVVFWGNVGVAVAEPLSLRPNSDFSLLKDLTVVSSVTSDAVEFGVPGGVQPPQGNVLSFDTISTLQLSFGDSLRDEARQKWFASYRPMRFAGGVSANSREPAALHAKAYWYFTFGETDKALGALDETLVGVRGGSSPRPAARVERDIFEADALDRAVQIHASPGDTVAALDIYSAAFDRQRRAGDLHGQAVTLNKLGLIYNSLGEYERALLYSDQALEIAREAGDKRTEAEILYRRGEISFKQDKTAHAVDYYERALGLYRQMGDGAGESRALGRIYAARGEAQKAREVYERMLHQPDGGLRLAETHFNIGQASMALGDYRKAIDHYESALELRRSADEKIGEADEKIGEAEALYRSALAYRAAGNSEKSTAQVEAALTLTELVRSSMPPSYELRSTYSASVQEYSGLYVDLLMDAHGRNPQGGFDAMAFEASESARARNFLELLSEAQIDIRQDADPALLKREQELRQRLDDKATERRLLPGGRHRAAQAAALEREISQLSIDYRNVQSNIRRANPHYTDMARPQPLGLNEIREQVLDADTLLLEYVLGEERSFLFAVTPTSIETHILPKRSEIEAAAFKAYRLLSSPPGRPDDKSQSPRGARGAEAVEAEVLRSLSEKLVGPVANQLGNKRLLVSSQGAVQLVPFGALPTPRGAAGGAEGAPLILNHEVVSIPSASTLAALRRMALKREPAPISVAVVADPVVDRNDERIPEDARRSARAEDADAKASQSLPRLLGTRWEATQIMSLVPPSKGKLALDFAASRATVLSPELNQYSIVHLATHVFVDQSHPELSGIVLSLFDERGHAQDGFVRLGDISNVKFPAELVVLSGCGTGISKQINGEGVLGLTRGFMPAGSPRIVFSLWGVDDQATADLMVRFYRNMLTGKQEPAAALRAAQVEMWKDPRWKPPYFWAAFMFQGEWKWGLETLQR